MRTQGMREFLSSLALTSLLACVTLPESAAAWPGPLVSGGYGSTLSMSDGVRRFRNGWAAQLDASWPGPASVAWLSRFSFLGYDQVSVDSTLLFNVGGTSAQGRESTNPIRVASLETGLRCCADLGMFRPFVEGLAGAARITPGPVHATYQNDRRPDLSLKPPPGARVAACFSLGAGFEVRGPASVGLEASIAAQWIPLEGVEAPLLPVRVAALWPVAASAHRERDVPASEHAPRLLLTTGTNFLQSPAVLRDHAGRGWAIGFGLEYPLSAGIAISVEGDQALQRPQAGVQFFDRTPPGDWSFTFTDVTAGIKVVHPLGRLKTFARGAVGWGRMMDDGTTIYFADPFGNLIPTAIPGRPLEGVAYSVYGGLELDAGNGAGVFVESGVLGMSRPDQSTGAVAIPIRLGVALR